MKKIMTLLIISNFITPHTFAKRVAPQDITPLIHNGIKYIVPHFGIFSNRPQNGGYIEAWNLKTKIKLWDLKIYTIKYDKNIEQDIQDIFITKIEIKNGNLVVMNEKNDIFIVDLNSKTIKPENKIYKITK